MDVEKPNPIVPDSSDDTCNEPEQSENAKSSVDPAPAKDEICNGEVTDSKQVDGEESNITSSNGSTKTGKGKSKGKHNFSIIIICILADLKFNTTQLKTS